MADLIKFLKKKKVELAFKSAGPGHKLNEESKKPISSQPVAQSSKFSKPEQSDEAKQAAAAALARFQNQNKQLSGIRNKASSSKQQKKEEKDSNNTISSFALPKNFADDNKTNANRMAVNGVFFQCSLLGPDILPKHEWKIKIKEYLYQQLEIEKGIAACLIIRNCNKNDEKIETCISLLSKYLQNIINNPKEEKYWKIRISNKIFQEKVACIEGSYEFLEAAGFSKVQEDDEEYFRISLDKLEDNESLEMLLDALRNSQRICLELDRNIQVLLPSQAEQRTDLPDEFFDYTVEELKREYQIRSESLENSLKLQTKVMRENQELPKNIRKYKYTLIRIRFPDGIYLQGTFSVNETFEEIIKFVRDKLNFECNFKLLLAETSKPLNKDSYQKSLLDLRLIPAVILIFHVDSVPENIECYLKPDVMALLQNL